MSRAGLLRGGGRSRYLPSKRRTYMYLGAAHALGQDGKYEGATYPSARDTKAVLSRLGQLMGLYKFPAGKDFTPHSGHLIKASEISKNRVGLKGLQSKLLVYNLLPPAHTSCNTATYSAGGPINYLMYIPRIVGDSVGVISALPTIQLLSSRNGFQ